MSELTLYQIFYSEFKDNFESLPNNEIKTKLKEGSELTLEELVECDRNISHHLLMYLESLTIFAAEKDYESSITYISNLIESHKTLVSRLPKYTEAFNTTFVDILATIASNIKSANDANRMKCSIEYLQKLNIDISSLLEALSVPYAALIWTDIEKIVLPEKVANEHMLQIKELIDNIKIGISLNLELDNLNDRAADLTIEFIEKDIDYFQMLSNGDNKILTPARMSKILLNKIKEIGPISEIYTTNIETFSSLLESVIIPTEIEAINISYNSPYPEYDFIDQAYYNTQDKFNLEIQTVRLKPYNKLAKIKKYSKNNQFPWMPQMFKTEIAILERLSLRAKYDNCFLELYGTKVLPDSVEILMENCTTDLYKLIQLFQSQNQKFSQFQLYQIICPLINAFAILHQEKIYHKDIKPSNILINKIDNNYYPKIADFGCSETFTDNSMKSSTNVIQGTKDFMPPEFFYEDDEPIYGPNKKSLHYSREKADVFSLGLTILSLSLLECITHLNLPTKFRKREEKINRVEDDVIKLLLSNMLNQAPKDRKSFAELIQYLPNNKTEPT